jgi:hypothetical protein
MRQAWLTVSTEKARLPNASCPKRSCGEKKQSTSRYFRLPRTGLQSQLGARVLPFATLARVSHRTLSQLTEVTAYSGPASVALVEASVTHVGAQLHAPL